MTPEELQNTLRMYGLTKSTNPESIAPDASNERIACAVRMLLRTDIDHEAVCKAARDRILKLTNENLRLKDIVFDLTEALKSIALIGGNLPDDRLTDKTGPNDAAYRGRLYCTAREMARLSVAKAEAR